jgi:hypothetical protein
MRIIGDRCRFSRPIRDFVPVLVERLAREELRASVDAYWLSGRRPDSWSSPGGGYGQAR